MKLRVSITKLRSKDEISPYRFSSIALLIGAFTTTVQILSVEQYDTKLIGAAICFAIAIPFLTTCAYYYMYTEARGFTVDHPLLFWSWFLGLFTTVVGFTNAFQHIGEPVWITFVISVTVAFFIGYVLEDPMVKSIESELNKAEHSTTSDTNN